MTPRDDPPTARHAALLAGCLREAADAGRPLMEMMVGKLRLFLLQQSRTEAPQQREPLAESLRLLDKHEERLCAGYPKALQDAFAQEISGPAPELAVAQPTFDELELMDETQVQESVEVTRALQTALHSTEHQLADLNALMCAVQGLQTVQAQRNPVRPHLFVRTLRNVLAQTDVAPAVWLGWIRHMGVTLGKELGAVYTSLGESLRAQGVKHAAYLVKPAPDLPRSAPTRQDAAGLTLAQLRRLLSGELDTHPDRSAFAARFAREFESSGEEPAPPAFAPTVPAAFEALQEMKQVDQVVQRLAQRAGDPAPAVPATVPARAPTREPLRHQARGLGQALGLEVVALMVENITRDPRLLAPVQQAVRDLEPALLQLTLIDPRFFSHKQHPARCLIEQMTSRSLAYPAVDAAGFTAFMRPLRRVVDTLVGTPIDSAEPFELALKSLAAVWSEQERRELEQRKMAMQVLAQAEQRNELARMAARDMRAWPQAALAPAPVMTFLCGPWAQVVAREKLERQQDDDGPESPLAVARDLLWSTRPGFPKSDVTRLTGMIAPLLGKLREGLAGIEYPAADADIFFSQLMAMHQRALKPPTGTSVPPDAKTAARARLEAMFRESDESGLWLAPSEAQQSGFIEATDSLLTRPPFAATEPMIRPQETEDASAGTPAGLSTAAAMVPGTWVELQLHGRWARMELTWASPRGHLFMFTGANDNTHSMTRHTLDQLLEAGTLRLFSDQAVVGSALDAVAKTALRNSVDITL